MNTTSSLVIAGRLILLLLASVATVSGFVLSPGRDVAARESRDRYACPMHPEVTSTTPGECPICRMALEQVQRGPSASALSPPAPRSALDTGPVQGPAALSHAESANLQDQGVIRTAKQQVFAREVRAPAWVDTAGRVVAVLYKDELIGLSPGEQGLFFPAAAPRVGMDVAMTAEPPAPWDGSTSRIHFRLASSAPPARPVARTHRSKPREYETGEQHTVRRLREGDIGWVKLAAKSHELLVVPSSAVLYSDEGPYVLVASPDRRTFAKRRVEVGTVFRSLVAVLSGLREQEPIAHSNTFFFDAERRLQSEWAETVEAIQ